MLKTTEDYPRPDFQRAGLRWRSLNGPWSFLFDDNDIGLTESWQYRGLPEHAVSTDHETTLKRTIQVPFVFQAPASRIHEQGIHEVLWYERQIEDPRSDSEREQRHRAVLRFGAVDYHARVWVGGQYVGEHEGGHVPFDLDITEALQAVSHSEQIQHYRLTVRVYDSATSLTQPRGKQYWGPKPENIFYTPSSGIWQSVWLESVPAMRIADSRQGTILRSHDIDGAMLDARVFVVGRRPREACSVELEVRLGGVLVRQSERKQLCQKEDFVRFPHHMRLTNEQIRQLPEGLLQEIPETNEHCWRNGVALWSPEHPTLYEVIMRAYDASSNLIDVVQTDVGMRSLDWTHGDSTFRLNGQPYFHALLLDQGYWPSTLMTPPSQEALKQDIELSKAMGFNGCRKHQKVEDPAFFYWANKLGFLVWGEMASAYQFSVEYADRFSREWMEMVRRDINHPSVVAWTIANESWGYPGLHKQPRQRDHLRSLYYATKTLDPTRPINDNCGWEHVLTDLSTFHDYAGANGMGERSESVRSILSRGKNMFLKAISAPDGVSDPGSAHKKGAPILCTEFGGVNIALANDAGRKENWGYTTAKDSADLLRRVERIVMATVKSGHVCGVVWTQLTDIEQEQNGLYSYDRKEKLPAAEVKKMMTRAAKTYLENRKSE